MKVLYIGGYSRSGSTMLLRVLGEASGTAPIGEFNYVWERGYQQGQLCGCGERFTRCEFWDEVSRAAFGRGSEKIPAQDIAALQRRVHGYGAFPQLWVPALRSASYRRDLSEYGDIVRSMYQAVSDVSGADLVLDSSKVPQFARMLSEVPSLELHVVHLVRDSRGTAHSWQREKVRTEIHWTTQAMDRHSLVRSSVEWDVFNLLLGADAHRPKSYTMVRYEDLVRNAGEILATVVEAVGDPELASELRPMSHEVGLRMSHTVAGNPSRFSTGPTKIVADDEWRKKMAPRRRALVTAITAPLLVRYGYPLRLARNGLRSSAR